MPKKRKKKTKKDFNILAKVKANIFKKKKEFKLPEFKIEKRHLIVLPKGDRIDFKYSLLPPFANVHLKWDKNRKELIYNLIEPQLNKEEKEIHKKRVKGLFEILEVELTALKKKEKVIDYLEEHIKKILDEYGIKLSKKSYLKIMYYIYRNFVGLNEIEPLMQDPYIEDVSCSGVGVPLYIVHRKYGSIKTNIVYNNSKELQEFIVKLAERCGRFISYAEPLLDGSLPDGSRVQASYASDVTTRGPTFTIRKFMEEPLSPINLINNNTIDSEILAYLWLAIEHGASILVGGGAAVGKTTFMNVLSMFIPPASKIVSIEDTRELNLPSENWIPSVTRMGFAKGYGEVKMFDLLKEGFRQSPDYVIVGEVRGEEAYVMFQGMAAGFPCMGTMHAGSVEEIVNRLQTPPINLPPTLVDTLDIVVIMVHAREKGETARRVKEVVEIESVDTTTGKARTGRAYAWSIIEDKFERKEEAIWLLQELSAHTGIGIDELRKEILRKKKVLDWMQKKNITHFKDVASIISEYYKSPESILKKAGVKG